MKYKKWSLEEKLEILSSCEESGVVETCRKYSLSTGTLYSWKKKLEKQGEQFDQLQTKLSYEDEAAIDFRNDLLHGNILMNNETTRIRKEIDN